MTREEALDLIAELGDMLQEAAEDGLDDLGGSIYSPAGPNSREHVAVQLGAMRLVGDLIQDWARDKLDPYRHLDEE